MIENRKEFRSQKNNLNADSADYTDGAEKVKRGEIWRAKGKGGLKWGMFEIYYLLLIIY